MILMFSKMRGKSAYGDSSKALLFQGVGLTIVFDLALKCNMNNGASVFNTILMITFLKSIFSRAEQIKKNVKSLISHHEKKSRSNVQK